VVAHEAAFDVAARMGVVRAGAAGAVRRPEGDLERLGLRAVAGPLGGALLALRGEHGGALGAVAAALGEQTDGAAPGEVVQAAVGVLVAADGLEVERARALAGRAAWPGLVGAGMRLVAPPAQVAGDVVGAEQVAGRGAALAERVVDDVQPVLAVAAAGGRRRGRDRRHAPGAGVRARAATRRFVEAETDRQPAQHVSLLFPGNAPDVGDYTRTSGVCKAFFLVGGFAGRLGVLPSPDGRNPSTRHRDREPKAWRVAIQGRVTNARRAALDRHAAKRRLAMTR